MNMFDTKDRQESYERTKGLFNITVTSFLNDGSIDLQSMTKTVERMLALGYDGFLIGGTYGEFPTLSTQECALIFRHIMDVVEDQVPVLLCTAHSDPRVVIELTTLASELGGLPMVTAPYVFEMTDQQIYSFFEHIADYSSTGIMIYNTPGIGITLSAALIERLSKIDGMVALKQGDLNPTAADQLASTVAGRIRVLAASDLVFLGPLTVGFYGFSSTNSCALPEIVHEIYHALVSDDIVKAGIIHGAWYIFRALARFFGQPQTTKAAMTLRGWANECVRAPLLALTDNEKIKLRSALQEIATATGHNLLKLATLKV